MNIGNNVSTVRQHQEEYDFKITKRHFPRDNNDSKKTRIYICVKTRLLFVGPLNLITMSCQTMATWQNYFQC